MSVSEGVPEYTPPAPTTGQVVRSLLFTVWLYGLIAVVGIGGLPLLLGPQRWVFAMTRLWARLVVWGLEVIAGVRMEVRGLEHRPTGPCLIGAKHQGMFDTIAPLLFLENPCFVLKQELMRIPVYGWFAAKAGHIAIDRAAHAKALRGLVHAARDRLGEGRPIIIYPEGTRRAPDDPPAYKPGVAALYRDLDVGCTPMATNSGVCWPAHGFLRRPGVIVFEFLPPIPPGLKRATFMAMLEDAVEDASTRLVAEARGVAARP